MELAGQGVTDEELENMLEAGEGAQLMGHVKIEGNEEQLRQTINDIQNRHEMFLNLEKSITELHDMFIDIAQLIENQVRQTFTFAFCKTTLLGFEGAVGPWRDI